MLSKESRSLIQRWVSNTGPIVKHFNRRRQLHKLIANANLSNFPFFLSLRSK